MSFKFEQPTFAPPRFKLSGKIVITITLVLVFILITSSLFDIIGAKRELSHVLTQQSEALIASIEAAGNNAIESYNVVQSLTASRMLGIARQLELLDQHGLVSNALLEHIAEKNNIFRINFFNSKGRKDYTSLYGRGQSSLREAPVDLLDAIREKENDELIMGFRQSQFNRGQRFAVAKRRSKGGVIVLNVDAREMLDFRKSIGLGRLLQDIGATEGIHYIAIQDSAGIIVATANIDSLSSIQSDPFLTEPLETGESVSRFIDYLDGRAFEIVRPLNQFQGAVIRLGVKTQHIEEAERAAILRALVSSLFLILFGGIVSSLLISGQNYRALKKSYDRIETYTGSILENMNEAVIAVDQLGAVTLVNAAAETLFDIDAEKIIGQPCRLEISTICPFLNNSLESQNGRTYLNEKIKSVQGFRIVDINVNVVLTEQKELFAVFAVVKDITEQKRLEENLKRTDQITAMGHLASGVAHEIRNPLNAIGMISQRLKGEFEPTEGNEEYMQLTSTVVSETRRINDIIQDFLQFTRPAELNKKQVNIKELLVDTMHLLKAHADARNIQLELDCPIVTLLSADSDKLKQVFLNLGQNAIAACSAGDNVSIACHENNEFIFIEFKDSGSGISQEHLNKIFNLYFTTKESGTGIGLSVVQQIISQHDGVIQAESIEGRGTTMSIRLPKN